MRWILSFLFTCLLTTTPLWSSELLPEDEQAFMQMKEQLFAVCAKDGKFLYDTIIEVDDGLDSLQFNCNAHLFALKEMYEAMVIRKTDADETGKLCLTPGQAGPARQPVEMAQKVAPVLHELNSCKEQSSLATCGGAFICSMVVGPFQGLLQKINVPNRKMQKVLRECSGVKNYECVGAALKGVWDNIVISAEAIWKILGMAKDGVAWTGKKLYDKSIGSIVDYFSKVEEVSSDKLLVASGMPPSLWEQLKKDPVKVIKELAAGFMKVLTAGIKNNYGCEQWSGVPFSSECLVPMQNWDCASCNQKINSICGVLGFAGGELVVAYLTGGATVAAKKLSELTYKGGSAVVNKILHPLRAYRISINNKMAANVLDTTVKVTGEVAQTAYKVSMRMKLRDFFYTAGNISYQVGSKVLNNKVFKVVSKSTKVVLTPIRKYIQLTDWAFMRGYEHTAIAFQSIQTKVIPHTVAFIAKYDSPTPEFMRFISDKEIGINVKTYGSYVASFDRGSRGRDETQKSESIQAPISP